MNKAIEVLMNEHRLIERVLGSLETLAVEATGGLAPERGVVLDYADFLRGFADVCHHGKEEDILFARMLERGFSREFGPVAVMLEEHRQGRAHVSALRAVGEAKGEVTREDRMTVVRHAGAFIPLLRVHIIKEDKILYPMALQALTPSELDAMQADFDAFAAKVAADGSLDRLHGLADRLIARFAPDPARMAAAADLMPCG